MKRLGLSWFRSHRTTTTAILITGLLFSTYGTPLFAGKVRRRIIALTAISMIGGCAWYVAQERPGEQVESGVKLVGRGQAVEAPEAIIAPGVETNTFQLLDAANARPQIVLMINSYANRPDDKREALLKFQAFVAGGMNSHFYENEKDPVRRARINPKAGTITIELNEIRVVDCGGSSAKLSMMLGPTEAPLTAEIALSDFKPGEINRVTFKTEVVKSLRATVTSNLSANLMWDGHAFVVTNAQMGIEVAPPFLDKVIDRRSFAGPAIGRRRINVLPGQEGQNNKLVAPNSRF